MSLAGLLTWYLPGYVPIWWVGVSYVRAGASSLRRPRPALSWLFLVTFVWWGFVLSSSTLSWTNGRGARALSAQDLLPFTIDNPLQVRQHTCLVLGGLDVVGTVRGIDANGIHNDDTLSSPAGGITVYYGQRVLQSAYNSMAMRTCGPER